MIDFLEKHEDAHFEPMRLIEFDGDKEFAVGENKEAITLSLSGILAEAGIVVAKWLGARFLTMIAKNIDPVMDLEVLIDKVLEKLLDVVTDEIRSELMRHDLMLTERKYRTLLRLMNTYETYGSSAVNIQSINEMAFEIYEGLRDHDLAGARLLAMTASILVSVEQEIVLIKHGHDPEKITDSDRSNVRASARNFASEIEVMVPRIEQAIPRRFGGIRIVRENEHEPNAPVLQSIGYLFDGKFKMVSYGHDDNSTREAIELAERRMKAHERSLMRSFPEAISDTVEKLRSI